MAKPGSSNARAINGRAHDLSLARMSDEQVQQLQEAAELEAGLRCSGCGRRIGVGFHFTSIGMREQQPILKLSACSRDDCDFAEKCRDGGTVMELVEYAWLDEAGIDAPPARMIVERNEKRAAAEAAAADSGDVG